jgi:hypothetical protein
MPTPSGSGRSLRLSTTFRLHSQQLRQNGICGGDGTQTAEQNSSRCAETSCARACGTCRRAQLRDWVGGGVNRACLLRIACQSRCKSSPRHFNECQSVAVGWLRMMQCTLATLALPSLCSRRPQLFLPEWPVSQSSQSWTSRVVCNHIQSVTQLARHCPTARLCVHVLL